MRVRTALLATLLVALAPRVAAAGERVVLVPFENLTRAAGAREALMAAVTEVLGRKGYEVLQGEEVETFLRLNRIRYLDALPVTRADELLKKLDAQVVLTGAILTYDRKGADPLVALSLTAVAAEGEVVWNAVGGLAASETKGVFDLAKTKDVAVVGRRLVDRMLEKVPAGQFSREVGGGRGLSLRRAPRVFRSADVTGKEMTVCVLPFENLSGSRDAARVVEAAIHQRFSRDAHVKALAPADLRQAVLAAGLRAPSRLTLESLRKLVVTARTPYFLQGTIFTYRAASGDSWSGTHAAVEVYLRLIDAESGRTVWSGLHGREGIDYETVLKFGAVRDPATLATHVVSELVDAFTRP